MLERLVLVPDGRLRAMRANRHESEQGIEVEAPECARVVAGAQVAFGDGRLDDGRNGERDERDEKRAVAPLKPASDAILMDTSTMDASEVFAKACEIIAAKLKN